MNNEFQITKYIYIIIIPLNKEPSNRELHEEKQIIQNKVA